MPVSSQDGVVNFISCDGIDSIEQILDTSLGRHLPLSNVCLCRHGLGLVNKHLVSDEVVILVADTRKLPEDNVRNSRRNLDTCIQFQRCPSCDSASAMNTLYSTRGHNCLLLNAEQLHMIRGRSRHSRTSGRGLTGRFPFLERHGLCCCPRCLFEQLRLAAFPETAFLSTTWCHVET